MIELRTVVMAYRLMMFPPIRDVLFDNVLLVIETGPEWV